MYVHGNPKTKKALKEMVEQGQEVRAFAPGLGTVPENGTCAVEGPHFPEPHRWYANVTIENNRIVKVK